MNPIETALIALLNQIGESDSIRDTQAYLDAVDAVAVARSFSDDTVGIRYTDMMAQACAYAEEAGAADE